MLSSKSSAVFKQASDEFWIANYEACRSVPVMAAYRTALFDDANAPLVRPSNP